jgi:hypothetical protein
LAALQDTNYNPLASRLAEALTAYGFAFREDARQRGSLEFIQLPTPTDEVEAVALEIVLDQIRAEIPRVTIKIKGDS